MAVGVATGIQDDFSWNQVALSAIGAGVGDKLAGVSGLSGAKTQLGRVLQAGARAALGSAITQGVGVATGLQDRFSWTGVAVAGVIGGASQFASEHLPDGPVYDDDGALKTPASQTNSAVSGVVAAIAGAAARSLIDGSDFGDNIAASLPDVIGATIGNMIAGQLVAAERHEAAQQHTRTSQDASDWANANGAVAQDFHADHPELTPFDASSLTLDFANPDDVSAYLKLHPALAVDPARFDQSYSVSDGDTVEEIAREYYGDDWRAGVSAIVAANHLRFNANGSPLIYAGRDITIPELAGLDDDSLARLARAGGDLIQNNTETTLNNEFAAENAAYEQLFGHSALFADSAPAAAPNPLHAGWGDTYVTAYDPGLFGWGGPLYNVTHPFARRWDDAFATRDAGYSNISGADYSTFDGWLQGGQGVLQVLGGFGEFISIPATGALESIGLLSGHSEARAEYDANFVFTVGTLATGTFELSGAGAAGDLRLLGGTSRMSTIATDEVANAWRLAACFAAGTMVHTRHGLRPIETIEIGDVVLAQPESQGERGWRRVIDVMQRDPQELVAVTIADGSRRETITATLEHPFWVKGAGWTGAQHLSEGQLVELADGGEGRVVGVERLTEKLPVFNFAVEGFHTYYVGELGVWVHNACRVDGIPAVTNPGPATPGILYHYTNEAGLTGILEDQALNPSLKTLNPSDVRYGNGQYLSDIAPGTLTPNQLSKKFLNLPFHGDRFTHYIAIDTAGLKVIEGRPGVFVVPNDVPLNLSDRIVGSGRVIAP